MYAIYVSVLMVVLRIPVKFRYFKFTHGDGKHQGYDKIIDFAELMVHAYLHFNIFQCVYTIAYQLHGLNTNVETLKYPNKRFDAVKILGVQR